MYIEREERRNREECWKVEWRMKLLVKHSRGQRKREQEMVKQQKKKVSRVQLKVYLYFLT